MTFAANKPPVSPCRGPEAKWTAGFRREIVVMRERRKVVAGPLDKERPARRRCGGPFKWRSQSATRIKPPSSQ
ncbi:hypothetical protein METY_2945 [Methylopila sp. Yamaguchi]|nr:hypothetical protein METY_2945 [Methylopila sp. Yamaguchi]